MQILIMIYLRQEDVVIDILAHRWNSFLYSPDYFVAAGDRCYKRFQFSAIMYGPKYLSVYNMLCATVIDIVIFIYKSH